MKSIAPDVEDHWENGVWIVGRETKQQSLAWGLGICCAIAQEDLGMNREEFISVVRGAWTIIKQRERKR